jgi:cell division protein ZapB
MPVECNAVFDYPTPPMNSPQLAEQLAERVDRMLVHHAELRRANGLLSAQVAVLTQERDSLKSRLNAARARVDALLDRLPEAALPSRHNLSTPTSLAKDFQ